MDCVAWVASLVVRTNVLAKGVGRVVTGFDCQSKILVYFYD